jgi:hypothetical protein
MFQKNQELRMADRTNKINPVSRMVPEGPGLKKSSRDRNS